MAWASRGPSAAPKTRQLSTVYPVLHCVSAGFQLLCWEFRNSVHLQAERLQRHSVPPLLETGEVVALGRAEKGRNLFDLW